MKYFVCTSFGISKESHRDKDQPIGGTRQGNRFSGDASRDTSSYIIKKVENNKFSAVIRAPIINKIIQRAAIVFIDNTNFYINGSNYNEKYKQCWIFIPNFVK